MDELKNILEENLDLVQGAESMEDLCARLKEKGIELSAEALKSLCKPAGCAQLDDDALDGVAGGVTLLATLLQINNGLIRVNGDAVPGTLEHRSGNPAQATTLEQRGSGGFRATTLEKHSDGFQTNKKPRSTLL